MSYRYDSGYLIMTVVIVLIFVLTIARGALVDESAAVRTLEAQGFTNIEVVDHAWFAVGLRGCDEKDAARFTANVTNAAGKRAEVYVCTGWLFKGGTVRVK